MKKWMMAVLVFAMAPLIARADTPAASAPNPAVHVEKMAVGTAIENKELTGTASSFDSSIGRVTCWSRVTTETAPVSIKHVWYADDKKESEVALEIKYPSARTWSSKNVWPGHWKVDAVGPSGDVLNSIEFTVGEAAAK